MLTVKGCRFMSKEAVPAHELPIHMMAGDGSLIFIVEVQLSDGFGKCALL